VTVFSESQNRHKWLHLWPQQCDGFCNIKADRQKVKKSHKKSQKKPAKTRLLKLSKTSRIVTAFSESQNCHKWSHLWPSQCDGFCNIKAGRHKKSQKELAKTRRSKLSKTSRIVTTFNRHKTESQMVTIVTVTLRYLGCVTFHTNPVFESSNRGCVNIEQEFVFK
jgi:hypothetical protein